MTVDLEHIAERAKQLGLSERSDHTRELDAAQARLDESLRDLRAVVARIQASS